MRRIQRWLHDCPNTPVADLETYPRRPAIWSRVEDGARHNLLTATAGRWLENAASTGVTFVPEHDLETALLHADELDRRLDALIPDRVGTAVRLVTALSRYDQRRFLQLLGKSTSRTRSLPTSDAEAYRSSVTGTSMGGCGCIPVPPIQVRPPGPQTCAARLL